MSPSLEDPAVTTPLGAPRTRRAPLRARVGHRDPLPAILVVLVLGLVLRVLLAFVWYPAQGYATDMQLFASWAETMYEQGPSAVYSTASQLDYPPGYLLVLWATAAAAHGVAALTDTSVGTLLGLFIKVPPMLADLALAALAARTAGRWARVRRGPRAGFGASVLACALVTFNPVIWYDSAIWGQVDAFSTLLSLIALVLLLEKRDMWVPALTVAALCTKPQAVVLVAVVVPVLARRHLFTRSFLRRRPVPGRPEATSASGLRVLAVGALGAVVAVLALLVPFDLQVLAAAPWQSMPVVGDLVGFVTLIQSTAAEYSVTSANALNIWSLIGSPSLVSQMAGGSVSWTLDSTVLFTLGPLSVTAAMVGTAASIVVAGAVAVGLLRRTDETAILVAYTLLAVTFFTVPTRVHERYLFPAYTTGAVLAAASIAAYLGYVLGSIATTANLHAVLAGKLEVSFARTTAARPQGTGGPGSGGQGGGGFGGSSSGVSTHFEQATLPWGQLARSEAVTTAAAYTHSALFVALFGAWLVLVARGTPGRRRGGAAQDDAGAALGAAQPSATTP